MEDASKLICAQLREIRRAKGLRQYYIAEALGIKPQALSQLELGKHCPSIDFLVRYAKIVDHDVTLTPRERIISR